MYHPFDEHGAIDLNLDPCEASDTADFKEKIVVREECWGEDGRMSGVSRACVDCQTTKTPLWRSGPQGPKSLCNACGIRYRKRRRAAALGLERGDKEKQGRRKKLGLSLKLRLLGKEEEEAAVLLMALSCGCVYA
ncbi:GATA transcription factor 16 [Nymphaea thermarum]|nr:GATA transcription factor 23-like [Nymphaea colorata]KAF3793827.1 GATA transcription factor 16 [Nymphaea thermarum]